MSYEFGVMSCPSFVISVFSVISKRSERFSAGELTEMFIPGTDVKVRNLTEKVDRQHLQINMLVAALYDASDKIDKLIDKDGVNTSQSNF